MMMSIGRQTDRQTHRHTNTEVDKLAAACRSSNSRTLNIVLIGRVALFDFLVAAQSSTVRSTAICRKIDQIDQILPINFKNLIKKTKKTLDIKEEAMVTGNPFESGPTKEEDVFRRCLSSAVNDISVTVCQVGSDTHACTQNAWKASKHWHGLATGLINFYFFLS